MFRGRSKHILDEKGRLAIPARFKEVLKEKGNDTLVVTNKGECLWAFPKDTWAILEEKVANMPLFDETGIAFLRSFISSAEECSRNGHCIFKEFYFLRRRMFTKKWKNHHIRQITRRSGIEQRSGRCRPSEEI